ncbi:MAG: hypothetical protein AAGF01_22710 [Cyanobacteria bacterium P01_G01_bin.38]
MILTLLAGLHLPGCQPEKVPLRTIQIQQEWALQPGGEVAGYAVSSGLGDITLELGGDGVQMPFTGEVQPTIGNCVVISSPEVPAYLFRLCGVRRPQLGQREQGQIVGRAQQLVFAALRKQPNGTWAMVEPSTALIENLLVEQ